LEKIRPLMRRNRRGPGGSGSASFLARALKCSEGDLVAGFAALGLTVPAAPTDQPAEVEISGDIWWLNKDSRGGLWINGREKAEGETAKPAVSGTPADASSESSPVAATQGATVDVNTAASVFPDESATKKLTEAAASAELPLVPSSAEKSVSAQDAGNVFSAVRLLLKETKTGSFAGKVGRVASELNKSDEELTNALVSIGLKVPEKARAKPVFVEHGGEIFWLNKNAKGELWVNAKASKFADKSDGSQNEDASAAQGGKRPARRGSSRSKPPAESSEPAS
jgi:hypothetical protein